jgi:hypothetical protein
MLKNRDSLTSALHAGRLTPGLSKAQEKCVKFGVIRKENSDLTQSLCDFLAIAARLRIMRNTTRVDSTMPRLAAAKSASSNVLLSLISRPLPSPPMRRQE